MLRTIAVIPAHNESRHIAAVVRATLPHVEEAIVIDDASTDDTATIARGAGARVLWHRVNLGKAGALKTGCEAALRRDAEVIVFLDGDGQHNPTHIAAFREALAADPALDIVFGSRQDTVAMPFIRRLGTKTLEFGMRRLFHIHMRDMQCGYRAFRTRVYPLLAWQSKNYHADAEITARVGTYRLRYRELPIETIYHDAYKGMTPIDGLTLLGKLLIWKLRL